MSTAPIRVTVWHEYVHEKNKPAVAKMYPHGMHVVMKQAIEQTLGNLAVVRTATLEEPEHGLTEQVLAETDVLTWWGHTAHKRVEDAIVDRVHQRVLEGMGLVVLHSGHYSKIFKKLMGTGCGLKWREVGERERLWCVNPGHPIAAGMAKDYFELEHTEMYGELFDIPTPDELIFISWFEGGDVFRSGCVWTRGRGKVFYFRPGHETYPIYYDENVRRVLGNGVKYVAPVTGRSPYSLEAPQIKVPLSPIPTRGV
ncbi:MAG: ThuA domain-containing protein [Phycisphaeraceae bacterium]|nr:ThuA domain-containing protein [Phycisphaeraceae bacterium]